MTVDLFPIDIAEELVKQIPKMSIHDMNWFIAVWKEYVEPDLDASCGICKERIFKNFKNLHGALLLRIKQHKLLEST